MPQHKRGPWSQGEDQYLLHLVNQFGAHNWVRISATMQTRSPKQCRERFHQSLKPNLNHDPITPEEGMLIEQMVAEMGKRWAEIARRLRGRSDNAVKNWWNGSMNRRQRGQHNQARRSDPRPVPQQPLPTYQPPPLCYGQAMYQQPPYPQPSSLPSNAPPYPQRHSGLIDTPLPSPSAFSQFSADGAPSLTSDNSSASGRSPNNGHVSIELPPLGSDRRQSGNNARCAPYPMEDYSAKADPNSLLHSSYLGPSYLSRPMRPQQQPLPPAPLLRSNAGPSPPQLPSISSFHIDPALSGRGSIPTSMPSSGPDSPKNKMSLSNLTH